jgi:ferritin-like metal-binding protein YciE
MKQEKWLRYKYHQTLADIYQLEHAMTNFDPRTRQNEEAELRKLIAEHEAAKTEFRAFLDAQKIRD